MGAYLHKMCVLITLSKNQKWTIVQVFTGLQARLQGDQMSQIIRFDSPSTTATTNIRTTKIKLSPDSKV